MSHHSQVVTMGAPSVRYPLLYMLAAKVSRRSGGKADSLASRVFLMVASTVLSKRKCQPGQKALGSMFGRSPRSIQRSIRALVESGLIIRYRRGKKLTNLYRLADWIWRRITGADRWQRVPKRGLSPAQESIFGALASLRAAYERAKQRGAPSPA